MKIIKNNIIPTKDFIALYFFGILFVRKENEKYMCKCVMNHENIHHAQAKELLFVFFYLLYIYIRMVYKTFQIRQGSI